MEYFLAVIIIVVVVTLAITFPMQTASAFLSLWAVDSMSKGL